MNYLHEQMDIRLLIPMNHFILWMSELLDVYVKSEGGSWLPATRRTIQ
jgi:hypothetical protein